MLTIMKASAGSGKTYNLARKYIVLLLKNRDRYAYRHILAVTFTNKATDEMKNRILKELHVLATEPSRSKYLEDLTEELGMKADEIGEKAGTVLHDILHDYSAFAVSTIDRFFQQTLKAISREIGQFASYQVELDKDSLVAESVDRILDSLTEDDGGLLSWLTDNVLEQIEQGGRYNMDANLLQMAVRLKSAQRQEALEKACLEDDDAYSKEKLMDIRRSCREIMSSFRAEVRSRARAALDVIENAGVDPTESNRGFMKYLYVYDELGDHDDIEAPKDTFMSKAPDPDQWFAKAKARMFLPRLLPQLSAPLDAFCALWGTEFQVYNTACILDSQIYGLGVAGELHRTYNDLMKEKNVLSIDDSNTLLKKIIDGSDAPFVYEKIGVRFDHFLLDEFQDTANVQWSNFRALLHNSESQGGENLIVGDVKQSIYRWRGSDWSLLDKTVPAEFPDFKEETLQKNWRSHAGIVRFNNDFFSAAASVLDAMIGESKSKGALSSIYKDVRQEAARKADADGRVSLTFCDKDKELQQVLESVNEARASGAGLADIAVLVRSNAVGEEVASFLIENGVTVITDDSLKVKGAVTVRRLVSLMSYIDNPSDTVDGYLAESLDIAMPEPCSSLVDMAECLLRGIKTGDKDGIWKGEALHIQSFMDHLLDYVSSKGNNLRGFLKYWEGENPSISSPSSGDSVRVMTIHKSKGLDFQYVIIPFAENITLYKAGDYWCTPSLEGTSLEGIADGVYDVTLSRTSESTLFAEHYRNESFLQMVDNLNTLYVAMTRAVLGMHIIAVTPSAKCLKALSKGELTQFSDLSQVLYWFVSESGIPETPVRSEGDGILTFEFGQMPDFDEYREEEQPVMTFDVGEGGEYPSYALNPELLDDDSEVVDVCERGRLRLSADAYDFFSDSGEAGVSASNRIRGVVLHDILAEVEGPDDLHSAVRNAVLSGALSAGEAEEAERLLSDRISSVEGYRWFCDGAEVLNEKSIIDTDGEMYRPDRVVLRDGTVTVVDYKFGEHYRKYERQLLKYADIWRRMGYEEVSAYLWYVQTGEIIKVG